MSESIYGNLVTTALPRVDLADGEVNFSIAMALAEGSYVEWHYGDTGETAYGQIVSLDPEGGEAVISPMALDDAGNLISTGRKKVVVSVALLVPTDKRPATPTGWPNTANPVGPNDTTMSDQELIDRWHEFSGLGGAEEDEVDLTDTTGTAATEASDLRAVLRHQSAERDNGPDLDEPESKSLLERWKRHFFGEEG